MTAQEFWSGWWWPAMTALLGFVFTGLVFVQWRARRKPHQLAWTIGLLMYAVAALMEAYSEFVGAWDPNVYRFYIVFAASMVGFLGLGSYYLLARKPAGPNIYLGMVVGWVLLFLWGVFDVELDMTKLVPGITVGGQALGSPTDFPRIMSLPLNITGTIFLLGGAVLSVWRFARKKEFAYRMWANVLIALATLVIAGAGSLAATGSPQMFYVAELVAAGLYLWGFLLASDLKKGAAAAKAHRAAEGG
jgi:hypothetical protein